MAAFFFAFFCKGGVMIYYLNLGFTLEQALVDIVKRYFDRLRLDTVYSNFHISVVNQHPFAHMVIDQNARCSDNFPAVVITTQRDSKPGDLMNMPPQTYSFECTSEELDAILESQYRNKMKIDENGELVPVVKGGLIQREQIPGYVIPFDPNAILKIKQIAESREDKKIYGLKIDNRRRDSVSIEIWAENNELKNQIYEQLRLLFSGTALFELQETYKFFGVDLLEHTISGERSSNYNYDFDTMLCGSHISFDVDYNVSQIIIDTEIDNTVKDLVVEVINHVKE